MTDLLVVGAGLYGLTIAERAATQLGLNVTVIEKRSHIGGNAHSYIDENTGVEVHTYGSHIFHTSNSRVIDYVQRFTGFNNYRHTVVSNHKGKIYSLPFNLGTINQFFGLALGPTEARKLIESQSSEYFGDPESNLDAKGISMIGKPLYEAFVKSYTAKQWQVDPNLLPASVIARLPVRYNYDNSYFNDKFQGIPTDGYFSWHQRMANHPRIDVKLGVDFFTDNHEFSKALTVGQIPIIYTGPIDRFFDYSHGRLNWRTVDFVTEKLDIDDFQGTSVINYPDLEVPFTRIHEFKHYHPEWEQSNGTVIMREFSRSTDLDDDPYYPVNSPADKNLLHEYRQLAEKVPGVHFGGRLGTYKYLDMHVAIASALVAAEAILPSLLKLRNLY